MSAMIVSLQMLGLLTSGILAETAYEEIAKRLLPIYGDAIMASDPAAPEPMEPPEPLNEEELLKQLR
jgi:hypothetical protein